MRGKNYEAPHYAALSSFMQVSPSWVKIQYSPEHLHCVFSV